MSILDPTSIANNLMQMEDTRRKWQEQAKDSEARANVALLAEAENLVDAMNAYADGYRQLSGEMQDFRPDWDRAQRQRAADDYRAWIDPRGLSERIRGHLQTLKGLQAQAGGLDDALLTSVSRLIDASGGFLGSTVDPLLRSKESDEDRARVIDALSGARTRQQAQPVADWVAQTRKYLADGSEQLRAASAERAALSTRLSPLRHFTVLPGARPSGGRSWYQRLFRLFR